MSEELLQMSAPELVDLQKTLFQKEDRVGLILHLDTLTKHAIDSWRLTKGTSDQQIEAIRDQQLLPSIQKIGQVCLGGLRFHNKTIYRESIERLQRIYDIGKRDELGSQRDFAHHPTLPSIHSLVQLYIIGAYLTYRHRWSYLIPLLSMKVTDYRRMPALVLSNPHLDRWTSSDLVPGRLESARKAIIESPDLFELYLGDTTAIVISLCEFDFLACLFACQHGQRQFPYFTNFSKSNLNLILEQLLDSPTDEALASFDRKVLAEMLLNQEKGERYYRNQWHAGDWSPAVDEFLKRYIKQEGGKS